MPRTILGFGETLWDLLPTGPKLGGAPFNFVYRVNQLGDTGIIISRLGRDELGTKAFEEIRALGMDTSCIQWDEEYPTGTVRITFDEQINADIFIVPDVAYGHIRVTDALLELACGSDCICFGTLVQRAPVAREALRRLLDVCSDVPSLLDINLRRDCYTLETVRESLHCANILKLNDDEASELCEMLELPNDGLDAINRELVERYSLDCSVITLGACGALATSADGAEVYVPGYEVKLADALGSGDAFTAAFLHKHLRGAPLDECCRYGNTLGAIVATQEGATAAITPEHVSEFLSGNPKRVIAPEMGEFAIE